MAYRASAVADRSKIISLKAIHNCNIFHFFAKSKATSRLPDIALKVLFIEKLN